MSVEDEPAGEKGWREIVGEAFSPPDPEDFASLSAEELDRQVLEDFSDDEDAAPSAVAPSSPAEKPRLTVDPQSERRELRPLLKGLYVENLKSLAGAHEIPLAPLTLIYGQNSAGKSTVLHALRLVSRAITLGRHDALHVWENCFNGSGGFTSLITGHDPYGRLVVGADFAVRDGFARAAIAVQPDPHVELIVQRSTLSANANHITSKTVTIDYSDLVGGPAHSEDPAFWVFDDDGDEGRRVRAENGLFGADEEELEDAIYDIAAHLVDLGPHRGDPKHEYEPAPQPFDFRRRGDYPSDRELNRALRRLEIPYRFEPPSGQPESQLRRRLVDTRTEVEVGLDQVGYGVSQLLPIVEACINSAGQVICIEQPELHIHPRLQAKLGNLFAESVRAKNQIIAETHSESLLLRVRNLIRRGQLSAPDVAVIYVDNDPVEGVIVHRLRLGAHGELLDPWPTGFFDDSLKDILGVTG